jgi:hypothetical protein
VEVDGVAFHVEGTRQAERDELKNAICKFRQHLNTETGTLEHKTDNI